MKIILFGATGMVGQGVLRECLLDPDVHEVLTVGRNPTGQGHAKLRELATPDPLDYSGIEADLGGADACFFCLGISSAGLDEAHYAKITYDITLAAAHTLARLNPRSTFIYVSGAGTDSTESGRSMWARVKGRTENALLRLPLKATMFRPGVIQPLHGIKSKTRLYRVFYALSAPLLPLLQLLWPNALTTTEQVGRAMLAIAKHGAPERILGTAEINALRTAPN